MTELILRQKGLPLMKIRHITAAVMAFAFAAVSLSGCMKTPDPDGTASLTVYDQNTSFSGEVTGWFADVIKDKFDISLTFKSADSSTFAAYTEQGTLGDIIVFSNENNYVTACNAEALLDWEYADCLKNYAPYINEHYQDSLSRTRSLNENNKIYGISGNISLDTDKHSDFDIIPYVRWDLYSALGYPSVNTLEDFESVISDMVSLASSDSGNVTGISLFTSWDNNMLACASAIASMYGYTEWGTGFYNINTDTYESCTAKDGIYIRALRFFNSLYRKGLIDKDSMSQTYDITTKDYEKGNAVFSLYSTLASGYNSATHIAQGKSMMPLVAADFKPECSQNSIYGSQYIWSVASNTKYPERCFEFINWMFSPDGILTTTYGPQSLTWDYDSEGLPYITDFGYECLTNTSTLMGDNYDGTYLDGFPDFGCPTLSKSTLIAGLDNVSYNYLTWDTTIKSPWYDKNYGAYDNTLGQWSKDTGYDSINSYVEAGGYTLYPASSYTMPSIPIDYALCKREIANDLCTYSWNAIYAGTEEEFNTIIDNMCTSIESRTDYKSVINFYSEQASEYHKSVQ